MINKVLSPLINGDHPELDTSIFLTEKDIKIYQSMIGSMQCMDCFHRMLWYIWTAITMLSSFRAQLRQGHLNQTKRVYCYLNMKHFKVRFRTDEPDYGNILDIPDYHTWLIGETPYTCMQWRVSNKSYSSSTRRERERAILLALTHYYDLERQLLEFSTSIIRHPLICIPRSKQKLK